jgi:hypothetical protein
MRRAESPIGLVVGLVDLSELPKRVPLRVSVGTIDAQELIRPNRDRQ